MANEIQYTTSLTCFKSSVMSAALSRSFTGKVFNMAGNFAIGPSTVSIGTSATAFPIGQIVNMGWCWFYNNDATNYVEIMNGASGADRLRYYPGEGSWQHLMPTYVPYGIANTAAVAVEYLLLSL